MLGRERGGRMIPLQSAPGKDNQDVRRPIFADPIFGLLRNPGRGGRFGRSKEDEEQRLIEGLANTRPEGGIHREVSLISKDVQSTPLVPGFGKRMERRLKGRCRRAISGVTVRDEGVVGHQLYEDTPTTRRLTQKVGMADASCMQTDRNWLRLAAVTP